MSSLPDDFPKVTHDEVLEIIDEVFRVGADDVDPREIFENNGDDFAGVPTRSSKNVPTMFPQVKSTT